MEKLPVDMLGNPIDIGCEVVVPGPGYLYLCKVISFDSVASRDSFGAPTIERNGWLLCKVIKHGAKDQYPVNNLYTKPESCIVHQSLVGSSGTVILPS